MAVAGRVVGELEGDDGSLAFPDEMMDSAQDACSLLKALAHESRLLILCLLAEGEKPVTALMEALDMRQPAVSQQLARLRADRLVNARRAGKTIYYSLANNESREIIKLLYKLYCAR